MLVGVSNDMTDEPGIDPPTTEPADAHGRAAAGTAVLDVELDSQRQRIDELAKNLDAYRISRDTWTIAVFVVSFLVLIGSMIAVGLAMRNNDDGSASAGQTITADLSEYAIALSSSQVTPGSKIDVANKGTMIHTLGVKGTDLITGQIAAGGTDTLDLSSLPPGNYTLFCDLPGHEGSGMSTPLVIAESGAARRACPP